MRAESTKAICLAVPGTLDTLTGGYLYDRRILDELADCGWQTSLLSLDRSFPMPSDTALTEAEAGFDAVPAGQRVVIDGLALAGLEPLLPAIVDRLDPVALIHHPLADETGIDSRRAEQLAASERSALAKISRVIVTSPWTKRRLADYGVKASRVTVVEPGIDRIPVTRQSPTSHVMLLTVATIIPRKGHAVLIEALSRLKRYDWTLRCAGSLELDRQCAAALRKQIDAAGLSDRVELLGELPPQAICQEYADADLFVLPSYLEGYGMALAEAIAYGLPVVSTTAGAIPDTVPAEASRLIPPGDTEQLIKVLDELLGSHSSRAALKRSARDAAITVPTWAQAARAFASALHQPSPA